MRPVVPSAKSTIDAVFEIISADASAGRRAAPREVMSQRTGRGLTAIATAIRRLCDGGKITVEGKGPSTQYRITATGAATLPVGAQQVHKMKPETVRRQCLVCSETFVAAGRFNRMCERCTGSAAGLPEQFK